MSMSMSSGAMRSLETAQKKGSTILNLKCVDAQTGLMGKSLLEFQSNKGDVLPPHKKSDLGSPPLGQGVVYRIKDTSITVAFEDIPEEGLNEVTYRRMKETLIQLSKGVQTGPAADLIPVLFGERSPTVSKKEIKFTPINSNLDHSQTGPSGCNSSFKTSHPPTTELFSLNRVESVIINLCFLRGNNSALANDIRKEMKALNGKLLKAKDRNTKRDVRKELKVLSKEERKRQQLAVTDVIKNADVVLTTLTGALTKKLDGFSFDLVIIDEAAQALEIACWNALLKSLYVSVDDSGDWIELMSNSKKVLPCPPLHFDGVGSRGILAGDHLQLPPTIQSVEAEAKGLGRTLFERLAELYGDDVMSMLTVQYRMHELIMNWSSEELYQGKYSSPFKCCSPFELEDVKKSSSTEPTILLIDTAGCDMEEKKDEEDSTLNEDNVFSLSMLKSKEDKLKVMEISTVDGFQGREKEAIIISMVRSNSKKEVGFSSDRRRMNVAVTQARRQCCIICDIETVSSDKFLKRLIEYFEEHGEYLSASEYQ
ncbi:hypothetical protein OROHE_012894 [Orobanche hederae]